MVRHDSITSVPETPPAAMPDQVENIKQLSSDDKHGSSGSETEGYEAESQTDSCSGDEGEGDSLATLYSPTHTLTFKVMGTTKIHGIQDIYSSCCKGLTGQWRKCTSGTCTRAR